MNDGKLEGEDEGSLMSIFLVIPVALIALVIFAWMLTSSSDKPSRDSKVTTCIHRAVPQADPAQSKASGPMEPVSPGC